MFFRIAHGAPEAKILVGVRQLHTKRRFGLYRIYIQRIAKQFDPFIFIRSKRRDVGWPYAC